MVNPIIKTDGSGVHKDGERDKPAPDKTAGESHPDTTSADNPSKTGTPTVDAQTSGAESKTSATHTMEYGEDTSKPKAVKSTDGVDSVRKAAEKSVIDRTSEMYRQNPNFEKDVKEAEKQIREANEKNKDM